MVTLTLSPLSGREYSSSRFTMRELFVTSTSPFAISLRRVQRSSADSIVREQRPCFGLN